jgi:hypothetical protein
MAGLLYWLLDTGVRILPQRDWEQREDRIYRSLYGSSIQIDVAGLLLPCLAGETLASVLEHPELEESKRTRAIEWAIGALAELHRLGFTHADAMAENVMVDSDAGIARWFDFETIHQPSRPAAWQRADDLRAVLVSCLVRTAPDKHAATLEFILDVYDDDEVTGILASSFTSVWQRPLAFHLSQGSLTFQSFREAARVITARIGE